MVESKYIRQLPSWVNKDLIVSRFCCRLLLDDSKRQKDKQAEGDVPDVVAKKVSRARK